MNKNYHIYIKSNEHPRTINTPMMGRTYYTKITVQGKEELVNKVNELRAKGEVIREVLTDLGTRIWL